LFGTLNPSADLDLPKRFYPVINNHSHYQKGFGNAPCMFATATALPKKTSLKRLRTGARGPRIFTRNAERNRNAAGALIACAQIWRYLPLKNQPAIVLAA
jgi:hypothetical protein